VKGRLSKPPVLLSYFFRIFTSPAFTVYKTH
jgi:hypothetical protein